MDESEAPARTSTATTRQSEPEVVAGIMSGEGQPVVYSYNTQAGRGIDARLAFVGAAAVLGVAAGMGLLRSLNPMSYLR